MKSNPPPSHVLEPKLLPLLQKLKSLYLIWHTHHHTLPKIHRYSLGQKIDTLMVETIEAVSVASFLPKEEKHPWVRLAIRKADTTKILLLILWETKSIDNKKYIHLSLPLEEIGRMLGGWSGQIQKNIKTPLRGGEEK